VKVKTKIALLRGINVGGKNRIKMADLRTTLSKAGLANVRTYIQSGNVAFESTLDCEPLEGLVRDAIKSDFGCVVPVLVRDQKYFAKVVSQCPFCPTDGSEFESKQLHVTFLGETPTAQAVRSLGGLEFEDEFRVVGDVVYLRLICGYSKTKLTNGFLEKKLIVAATSRNWKTLTKLVEM